MNKEDREYLKRCKAERAAYLAQCAARAAEVDAAMRAEVLRKERGVPPPSEAEEREAFEANRTFADTQGKELQMIMTAWEKEFGDNTLLVSSIDPTGPTGMALHEATNKTSWSTKAVGRWLLGHKNRMKAGKSFIVAERVSGKTFWKLNGAKHIPEPATHNPHCAPVDDDEVGF